MRPKLKQQKKRSAQPFLPARRIKIRVVGIGGGGSSIVSEMAQKGLQGVSFLAADTDRRVVRLVKNKRKVKVFQFGQDALGGMGTGMDPELALKAALADKEKISRIFQGQDLVVLVGSLGGGVASGAGPVFANLARTKKNIVLGIFTLPFSFEGEKKMKLARRALDNLKENLSAVVITPNEHIFRLVDKKTPLKKSLSQLNQMFAGWLVDLIEVISKPNLINIDFADLRAVLKGSGEDLFFGQAETAGPQRAEEAVKKIFRNPLVENQVIFVKRILFNIAGGKDLTIKEVQTVSSEIAKLNEKAKIIFGLAQCPKHNGRLKISLLAVGGGRLSGKKEQSKAKIEKGGLAKGSKQKVSQQKIDNSQTKKNGSSGNKIAAISKEKLAPSPAKGEKKVKRQRRTALEAQKAEKEAEEKEWQVDNNWQIPAFLRNKSA